jgi:cyclohexanone monooxygenase
MSLSEKWDDGATTMHGIHFHSIPNFLLSGTRQGSWANNFPHSQDEVARHIAYIISNARKRDADIVEVTKKAEASWVKLHEQRAERLTMIWGDCTPSYFNREGSPEKTIARDGTFGGLIMEFMEILHQWREKGGMAGLALTSAAARGADATR